MQPTRQIPWRVPGEVFFLVALGVLAWAVSAFVWFARVVRERLPSLAARFAIVLVLQVLWILECISVADEGRRPGWAGCAWFAKSSTEAQIYFS